MQKFIDQLKLALLQREILEVCVFQILCGAAVTPVVNAGRAPGSLTVTAQTRPRYVGPNAIISPPLANGQNTIAMNYKTLQKGGTYCNGGAQKILVGGTITLKKNGQCVGMPTKADGSACCTMQIWQPSNDGYYYDNCSMKCAPLLPVSVAGPHSLYFLNRHRIP